MPLKENTLKEYGKGHRFIETGTHKGDGIQRALDAGFRHITSIEINRKSVKHARKRFSEETKSGRVQILQGRSAEVFKSILPDIRETVTFWLDAHGGNTSEIYNELAAIKKFLECPPVILIDDIVLMQSNSHSWGKTIDIGVVITMLKQIYTGNSLKNIKYVDGKRTNDILVAIPYE